MDHTSGGQREAEHEVTSEQREEWRERRLFSRAVQLDVELQDLARAAAAHGNPDADLLAARAQAARAALAGRSMEGVTHVLVREQVRGRSDTYGAVLMGVTETRSLTTPDRGDHPPFAAELAVDRPPHADDGRG